MEEIIELCSSIITPAKKSSIYLKSNKNRSNQIADCTRLCALNTSKLIEQINVQNASITSKDMQVVRKNLEVTAKRAKVALLKMIETTKETLSTSNSSLYSKLSDSCFGVISCVEEIIEIFWEILKKEKQDLISKHSTKLHNDLLILLSFLNEEPLEEELAGIAIEDCEFSLKKLSDEVGKPKFQTALSEYFREISALTQLCFSSPSHQKEKSKAIDLISNSKLFIRSLIQNSETEESSPSSNNNINNVNLSHNNNYEEHSHTDVNNNNKKLSEKLDTDNNESNSNNNNDMTNEQAGDSPQISEEEINNLVFIPRSDTLSSSSSPPTPTRGISPSSTTEKSSFFVGRKHTPSNQSTTHRDGRGVGSSIGNKLAAQRMRKIDSPLDKENDEKTSDKEDYKKAEKMVEFFMEQFAEFGEVWNTKNETKKRDLLKVLSSELDEILQPKLHLQLNRSTTSRELQDIIKMRSIADLAKISFNLPENEEVSFTIKQLAESVLSVIVGASTSVIQPSDDIQLEQSVNDLYLSLIDVLKRTPVQGFSDSVKRVVSETITLLEEQNNNSSSLFSIDQHVVKAAKGQGAKLIEYQMKMAIWRDCESLRILTTCLISMINSCYSNELTAGLLFQLSSCVRCSTTCLSDLLIHSTTTKHIMMNRDSSQGQLKNENSEEDMNIWNEKNNKLKLVMKEANEKQAGKLCIRAASLNKLVQALTSDKNLDNTFLKTFITTYRSFTTPWQLLSKLLERYDVPSSVEEKRSFAIKLRVAVVVKYWVDNQFYDFDDDLIQKLFQFCETLQSDGQTVAKLLHDLLISKSQERKMKQDSMINIPPTDLTFASTVMNPATLFMNYTDEEIARQITLVDFNIYKSIQVEELLQGAWSSDKLKHRSPNVTALLGRLNKLSFFVPSLILWQERKRDRAFIIAKFIRIAELLRKMNNYNSLMGIVAGLNVSSITRLKHTYLEIDPKLTQQFQVLEKIMDPGLAFKNYRAALSLSKLPTLPYLGVYLTDLTFIEDGNPDNIKSPKHPEKDLINFQKRDMVYNILQQILDFQQTPFPFPVLEPIHTLLTEFPHETERELYSLSTLHEPRNADPKSIV